MAGRSERCRMRNAAVAERYRYWTEEQRLRFDDAVRQLAENEFFLSEYTIVRILKDEAGRSRDPLIRQIKVPRLPRKRRRRRR